MRAAISLLVSSLVFGPLASNCQAMVNHLSYGLPSTPASEQWLSAASDQQASDDAPRHRGSGRREVT
ncbi:heterocyst-inhibiting protein PatX [uncultured Nostoc sp.]|uniref:heterocyst-inhibiting protein PatX n=1 Tax=uncultured Nostoc sp. TaxID=340711 RepID=UPI0035CB077A